MRMWRNGIRSGLKIRRGNLRSSNLLIRTKKAPVTAGNTTVQELFVILEFMLIPKRFLANERGGIRMGKLKMQADTSIIVRQAFDTSLPTR